jgi:hypothetical protein
MRILGIVIAIGLGVFIVSGFVLGFDLYSRIIEIDNLLLLDIQIHSESYMTVDQIYNSVWTKIQMITVFTLVAIGLEGILINKLR